MTKAAPCYYEKKNYPLHGLWYVCLTSCRNCYDIASEGKFFVMNWIPRLRFMLQGIPPLPHIPFHVDIQHSMGNYTC